MGGVAREAGYRGFIIDDANGHPTPPQAANDAKPLIAASNYYSADPLRCRGGGGCSYPGTRYAMSRRRESASGNWWRIILNRKLCWRGAGQARKVPLPV